MAKIYVSDYKSYNHGSCRGQWIDIDHLSGSEIQEEISKVLEENSSALGEICEEPMISDYEGFPKYLYAESNMDLDELSEYLELEDHQKRAVDILVDQGWSVASAIEHKDEVSIYNNFEEYLRETGWFEPIPEEYHQYIDTERVQRDFSADGNIVELEEGDEIAVIYC